jgi:hypothetical protein
MDMANPGSDAFDNSNTISVFPSVIYKDLRCVIRLLLRSAFRTHLHLLSIIFVFTQFVATYLYAHCEKVALHDNARRRK